MPEEGWVSRDVEGSGVSLIDLTPGTPPLILGSRVTKLSALSLAGLLEFSNTCLDASAVRAGKSTSDYCAWLIEAQGGKGGQSHGEKSTCLGSYYLCFFTHLYSIS